MSNLDLDITIQEVLKVMRSARNRKLQVVFLVIFFFGGGNHEKSHDWKTYEKCQVNILHVKIGQNLHESARLCASFLKGQGHQGIFSLIKGTLWLEVSGLRLLLIVF